MVTERPVLQRRVPLTRSARNSVSDGGESSNGNSGMCSVDGIRTYKRRKNSRHSSEDNLREDDVRLFVEAAGQLAGKEIKRQQDHIMYSSFHEKNGLTRVDTLSSQGSDDLPLGHSTKFLLQHASQSFDANGGGIGNCIQDALASSQYASTHMHKSYGASEQTAQCKGSLGCHKDNKMRFSKLPNDSNSFLINLNAAKECTPIASDGSQSKTNDPANSNGITELCQRVFRDVIVTEDFAMLSKLLCQNFQGIKVDKFSDFSIIDSRIKEGVYGKSPTLFSADIQQLWRNFQKIGTQMTTLAKALSELTKRLCHEEIGVSINDNCVEENDEETNQVCPERLNCLGSETTKPYPSLESEAKSTQEQADVSGSGKVCTCRQCGDAAVGRDCLVCDSCEEMYHISCVGLPGGCIPSGSWYCNNCFDPKLIAKHDNCVICERINNTGNKMDEGGSEKEQITKNYEETSCPCMQAKDMYGSSKKLELVNRKLELYGQSSKKNGVTCKLCACNLEDDGNFRICQHPLCLYKYYHERCLTSQQLRTCATRWYCPSCLCRTCLTDRDDDKVVLCDGCDNAYHIYCMNPPRSTIPRGKWFCKLCEKRIQAIRKAKMMYEKLQKAQGRNTVGGINTAIGSVEMLLSAAEKLKYDEKLASTEVET